MPKLKELAAGKIRGVYIPKGWDPNSAPQEAAMLTPEVAQGLGLALYRPHDKDMAAALFNPSKVPHKEVVEKDKAGKLHSFFMPITKFFGDEKSVAPKKDNGAESGSGTAPSPTAAGGTPTQDTPLGMGDQPVPILPKPTFDADAQHAAAALRLNALAGKQLPSNRPLPGQGAVLNGLIARPV
jgi:hypothetical protein